MKKNTTHNLTVAAMLSAVAFILMFIEFPIPMLIPSFVKMDFSDLPALLGAFALGPVYGAVISFMKNLLHIVIKGTSTACVGELCNFMLGVEDHARALYCVATTGKVGETYNIGGHNERKNLDVVETICELLEELAPNKPHGVVHYRDLITFVADRPGHDLRYAIDASKIARELGWLPQETFESGMRKTVQWYLANESWWKQVQDGSYQGERLGLKG